MPFVYARKDEPWPEDDPEYEPPPPKPSDFMYLEPRDFGGAREPVAIGVRDPSEIVVEPEPVNPPLIVDMRPRGVLPRLLDALGLNQAAAPPPPPPRRWWADGEVMAHLFPLLREIGVVRVHCRYDGGHDEGFAWIAGAETESERLDAAGLTDRLLAAGALARLAKPGMPAIGYVGSQGDERTRFAQTLDFGLAGEWAERLLGRGYGTGEYVMYGAFIADLAAGEIREDPKAPPETRNVAIDSSG